MAALALVSAAAGASPAARSLYEVEEHLAALADTVELVTPEMEQQFLEEFRSALAATAEKRDRVAHYLAQLEQQQAFASAEISRLQAFKKSKEAEQTRLEGYVSYVIDSLGKDGKGKYRKLEGNTTTMFLRGIADKVDFTNEFDVPLSYKHATVTMPADLWNDVLNAMDDDFRDQVIAATAQTTALAVDKRAVKAALDADVEVPGAKLITGRHSLGRK